MSQSTANDAPSVAANNDTWEPAWQRDLKFSKVFAPYSRVKEYRSGRPLPELWDIHNGCILWLPARVEIEDKIIPGSKIALENEGFFDHPVIVLSVELISPTAALLTCALMSSFGNRDLRQAKDASNWQYYLPIVPSAPHPISRIQLRLDSKSEKRHMKENSYICLEKTFTVDFTALRCYSVGQKADGYRHRLNKESFEQLIHALGMESGLWIKTDALWETFEKYLESQI